MKENDTRQKVFEWVGSVDVVFLFTIKFVGFCQRTNRQRANHTISREKGGDYRAMASSQGVLNGGKRKRKREGFDGWMVWR